MPTMRLSVRCSSALASSSSSSPSLRFTAGVTTGFASFKPCSFSMPDTKCVVGQLQMVSPCRKYLAPTYVCVELAESGGVTFMVKYCCISPTTSHSCELEPTTIKSSTCTARSTKSVGCASDRVKPSREREHVSKVPMEESRSVPQTVQSSLETPNRVIVLVETLRRLFETLKELRINFTSSCLHSMSSNIDIKMIHPANSSASHCMLFIKFRISSMIPIVVNLGKILHTNSVFPPSIRIKYLRKLFFPKPFNFLLTSFICRTRIVYFTLTEY